MARRKKAVAFASYTGSGKCPAALPASARDSQEGWSSLRCVPETGLEMQRVGSMTRLRQHPGFMPSTRKASARGCNDPNLTGGDPLVCQALAHLSCHAVGSSDDSARRDKMTSNAASENVPNLRFRSSATVFLALICSSDPGKSRIQATAPPPSARRCLAPATHGSNPPSLSHRRSRRSALAIGSQPIRPGSCLGQPRPVPESLTALTLGQN
jgi:hypothetical protein